MLQKSNIYWQEVPVFIVTLLLTMSGIVKASGHHPMAAHFATIGFGPYLFALGNAETLLALLFVLPLSRKAGLLFLTAYFGGAIAVELPHQMAGGPAVVLTLIWITAYLSNPLLFKNGPQTFVNA